MLPFGIKTRCWVAALLAVGILVASAVGAAGARGLSAQEGIGNFGRINEGVWRGAQPDAAGITNLARLGVKTIINLRMAGDGWKGEEEEASAHGILYTNLPLRGIGRPTDAEIRKALQLIEMLPGPVFIHCEHGCDRTGTVIACYRIRHDHWGSDRALEEAGRYGLSPLERGMKKCILDFGKASARPP